jgi:hypothetical protein
VHVALPAFSQPPRNTDFPGSTRRPKRVREAASVTQPDLGNQAPDFFDQGNQAPDFFDQGLGRAWKGGRFQSPKSSERQLQKVTEVAGQSGGRRSTSADETF